MKAPRLVQVDITSLDIPAAASSWKRALNIAFIPASNAQAASAVSGIELRLEAAMPGDPNGLASLVFEVDDLETSVSRLSEMGAVVAAEGPATAGQRSIDLDPGSAFGVRIKLRSPRPV
jgi:glyoxalase/bleomycin resistance protein/dioxygenase superfamily protein